jgi:hypothetical protein
MLASPFETDEAQRGNLSSQSEHKVRSSENLKLPNRRSYFQNVASLIQYQRDIVVYFVVTYFLDNHHIHYLD